MLDHIFLCVPKEPGKMVEARGCEPSKRPHLKLCPDKTAFVKTSRMSLWPVSTPSIGARARAGSVQILDRDWVIQTLNGRDKIDRLLREWELDIIKLETVTDET
jgi:hypothetical protein